MLKKYRVYIIVFYILSAASLITASFIDLKLDIFLNNPNTAFGLWFEGMGEMPCRLICPAAGTIIFYLAEKKALKIFGLIVSLGGSAYAGYHISYYFFPDHPISYFGWGIGLFFGLIILYLAQFITFDNDLKKAFIILSVAGIIIMFVQLGLIEIIKMLFGRFRFREMLKLGSFEMFTPWFKPNGINGHKSFPSGHTAGASMSYLLMLVPFVSEKWKNRKALCFLIPFVHTSIVAFTRLIEGAHFLSDVTVGGTIGFTTVIVGIYILDKKFFNKEKQPD